MARKKKSPVSATPVAEGVRFRVGSATAFAVRRESKDVALRIRRERRPFRQFAEKVPFLRGMIRLVSSVGDLLDGIFESAELDPQRIAKGTRFEQRFAQLFRIHPEGMVAFGSAILILLILASLVAGVPAMVAYYLKPSPTLSRAAVNGIVCVIRVLGTFAAIWLCVRLRVVNRLRMYRGAINKVLNAYESGQKRMTHASAAMASRIYRKSDGAFVTIVVLLSIVAFALIRTFTLPVQLLVRILLMLVIAGVVDEPIRLIENLRPDHPLAVLRAPYMWLERMFVLEPHNQMVEVAVYAFNAARENDY